MAVEDEIRQASERFYAALNRVINGDPGPMVEVWSHGSDVSAMHPLGGRSLGWEEVRAAWEQVAQGFSDGQVSLDDLVVASVADDAAYTLGTEHGQAKLGGESVRVDWRATNIYRREAGEWKMVHHHTDVSPAVVETLERLEGQQQGR
jgi:ketosteroid isomerase-like protein